MTGVDIRLGSLFSGGRALITAFDHGTTLPVSAPARRTLEAVVSGEPEGVLLGPGLLRTGADLFARRGAPVPVLRVDWTVIDDASRSLHGEHHRVTLSPAEALAMGAGAVCMYLISGPPDGRQFADNVAAVARAAAEADRAGIPLIVEATLWGSMHTAKKDPRALLHVCRIAYELGAHAIKTEYPGDVDTMRELVAAVDCPVLTLGGAATDPATVRRNAAGALAAGVRGLIFGRNVWDTDDPAATTRTLSDIVHNRTVPDAGETT